MRLWSLLQHIITHIMQQARIMDDYVKTDDTRTPKKVHAI